MIRGAIAPAQPRRAGLPLRLFLLFVLVLLSGALQRPVGGDLLQGTISQIVVQGQNAAIQRLGVATLAVVGLLVLLDPRRLTLPPGLGWGLALTVLAVLSALWSPLPADTMRRAAGFAGGTLCAVWMLSRFRFDDFVAVLVWLAAALILATAGLAVLAPGYAFHSGAEFFAEHAGLLKGSYAHKNSLARVLALCLVILAAFGTDVMRRAIVRALLALGLGLLALTDSAKIFLALPLALGMAVVLTALTTLRARVGLLAGGLVIAGAARLSGLDSWLMGLALDLLDRDPTLSARTLIWQAALEAGRANSLLLGGGYEAAWRGGIGAFVRSAIGFDPLHPHNGFLAVYLDLGLVGLGLVLAHLGLIVGRLIGATDPACAAVTRFLAGWMVLFFVANLAGSYLILPMDLYWVLLLLAPVLPGWRRRDAPGEAARPARRAGSAGGQPDCGQIAARQFRPVALGNDLGRQRFLRAIAIAQRHIMPPGDAGQPRPIGGAGLKAARGGDIGAGAGARLDLRAQQDHVLPGNR